jgi:hypothetical protein
MKKEVQCYGLQLAAEGPRNVMEPSNTGISRTRHCPTPKANSLARSCMSKCSTCNCDHDYEPGYFLGAWSPISIPPPHHAGLVSPNFKTAQNDIVVV